METNAFLEKEKTGTLMRKFALPCILSLVVGALYNIADQIFIANASYLGSCGNAANTAVFPLTVVALAIAVMIGDGCCAFVSIMLGARQKERAAASIGNAVTLAVVSGLVLMFIYMIFSESLLKMFGAGVNQETFDFAKEYFVLITAGIPFYIFGQGLNPVIRSDGSPKYAMIAVLTGAIINIVLDPVLIYLAHWGMTGAALATMAGQVVTAVITLVYFFKIKCVHLTAECFKPSFSVIREFIPLGMCSFLAQISLVAAMAAINNMILKYGALDPVFGQTQYAQIPMAVIGIVMKVYQIIISVVIGMAAGCIPIVGYNIGAGRQDRAKEVFKRLLVAEAVIGIIALIIAEFFPGQIISLFGAASEGQIYTDFAVKSFRIYFCLIILACINKAVFIFLQSLGKAWTSTFLSVLREVVLGVSLALILPVFFGLDGVLYSMPCSDVLTFIATVIFIRITMKELSGAPVANARRIAEEDECEFGLEQNK
ncbi:MAG: MATE family efflux transporter [Eubacteriaceae bacterium]